MTSAPPEVTAPDLAPESAPESAPELTPARRARLEAARAFAVEAARLCADRRSNNVKALDLTGLSPVCDFFVLATANSARQMAAIARELEELAQEHDLRPMHSVRRAEPNDRWVAIDLVDVIVHLFSDEARLFYDLDNLWGEAKVLDWNEGRTPAFTSDDDDFASDDHD